jgi:hypothetical protein
MKARSGSIPNSPRLFNRLDFRIVNQLRPLTRGSNDTDDHVVSQSRCLTYALQTAAFTVRLQHLSNWLTTYMAAIVETIEVFLKGLMASGAEIALMSVGHLAMFVNCGVSA